MPSPLSRSLLPGALTFIGLGADPDVDSAFDLASDNAAFEYGVSSGVPNLATADASKIAIRSQDPVSLALALAFARDDLGSSEPGVVMARSICADSRYSRRRVSLTIKDPAVELPAEGPVALDGPLVALLNDLAGTDGAAPGEFLESAEIRSVRSGYKALATAYQGKPAKSFGVLGPGNVLLLEGLPTATEARKAGLELVKAGPLDDLEQFELSVIGIVRRPEGAPFASIRRHRASQRASVRLVYATPKPTAKVKIISWLFYGTER